METIKKFKPNVKPCNNGFYKVNYEVPCDRDYQPYLNKMGKIVMAEILDENKARLISTEKHDPTWKLSSYKNLGWFEKTVEVKNLNFYSPN